MEKRLPHHLPSRYGCKRPQVAMVPKPRLHRLLEYGGSCRPRQCTAGTIKPLVESLASRSDDRRGGLCGIRLLEAKVETILSSARERRIASRSLSEGCASRRPVGSQRRCYGRKR